MDEKSARPQPPKPALKRPKPWNQKPPSLRFKDLDSAKKALTQSGYIADANLATVIFLANKLNQPLLLEGAPGVGKTYLALALAKAFQTQLIRMQCYEGLDAQSTLYEWNYQKQMIAIQQNKDKSGKMPERSLFRKEYLLERPLLKSIQLRKPPVLLIDEVDRADEEFEAYLLEFLSDFQVSVPELGTIKANSIPFCILTSNGVRELSDALRRRCMYYYLGYPHPNLEKGIIRRIRPNIDEQLVDKIVDFVGRLRHERRLEKKPGVAETLKWVEALLCIGVTNIEEMQNSDLVHASTACLVKTAADREYLETRQEQLLAGD